MPPVKIWVDADACPRMIKEILYRASQRKRIAMTLVANRPLQVPTSPLIDTLVVAAGFDVADATIVEQLQSGDLVITADIPLAAAVLQKGGHALNPRGELYTEDSIHERLAVHNLLDELRGAGIETGGPPALGNADKAAFANQLDRFLARI